MQASSIYPKGSSVIAPTAEAVLPFVPGYISTGAVDRDNNGAGTILFCKLEANSPVELREYTADVFSSTPQGN